MFFSYQILCRKNGSFAIIWRYMHDRHSTIKFNKKELLEIDIEQACVDLRNHIPTGKLETTELRNKMSLYLLAQLSYGVTLVLDVKAEFLINDLQKLLSSLIRYPVEEEGVKRVKRPRKRRTGEAILEPISAEQLLEEEEQGRKKRRTSQRTKGPSLLNLSDARAYVDQQVPGTIRQPEQPMEELHELEDMFIDHGEPVVLPPPEWPPLEEHRAETKLKVSVANIFPSSTEKEEFIRELGEPIFIQNNIAESGELIEEIPGPELPVEQARSPQYHIEERVEQMFDELKLDALPDLVMPAPRPRRRPRGLIIDERTELTHHEIMNQLSDITDITRTLEDLHAEIMRPELPSLSEMFDPLPKGMSEKLRPLFETVLKNYRERPLTFQEAQHMTDEDLQVRRFDVEVASWHSTPTERQVSMIQPEQISELPPLPIEKARQKVSVLALHEDFELMEQVRRETLQRTMSGREPKVSTVVDESFVARPIDLEQSRDETIGFQDITLPRELILLKESPAIEEEIWVDDEMNELYNRIVGKQGTERASIYFDEINDDVKGDRKRAARRFFTLLNLLKRGTIKARQIHAYGRIEIRVTTRGWQQLDTSFGHSEANVSNV